MFQRLATPFENMNKYFPCQMRRHFFGRSRFALVLLVATLVLAGCGKAKSPPASPAAPAADAPAATPAPTATATAPAKSQPVIAAPNGEPDLPSLNRALMRWLMGNKRPPANFADFAATAGVTIPPPPAGKKYVIGKNMHIELVKQ